MCRTGSGLLVRTLSEAMLDQRNAANPPGQASGLGKRLAVRCSTAAAGVAMLCIVAWERSGKLTVSGHLSVGDVLLKLVVPAVGSILTWVLAFSPIPTLLEDRHYDRLTVDPTPFPAYFIATFGWCIFAAVTADPWTFVGNFPPMLSFLFCTLSSFRLCKSQLMAERLEQLTMAGVVVLALMIMGTLSPVIIESGLIRLRVAGTIAPTLTCWQAMAPSFEAISAVRRRDASLLSLPLSLAGMLCSSFWTLYGAAISQRAIWLPNGTLFLLSSFNLAVKCCIGSPAAKRSGQSLRALDL